MEVAGTYMEDRALELHGWDGWRIGDGTPAIGSHETPLRQVLNLSPSTPDTPAGIFTLEAQGNGSVAGGSTDK